MKILAVIPARGGSKGIPRKNLVEVAGKPLIQYSLDIVKELGDLVLPFVSTDDEEISSYCSTQGFDMSYRRPASLALDSSASIDAVFDALSWYQLNKNTTIDAVLLLQPTNPLRFVEELRIAIQGFEDQRERIASLVSVTPMREHPYECLERRENNWGYLKNAPDNAHGRQQYKSDFYFIDGTFYLATIQFLNLYKKFVIEGLTELFYLDRVWPIDIDDPDDLVIASAFLDKINKNNS